MKKYCSENGEKNYKKYAMILIVNSELRSELTNTNFDETNKTDVAILTNATHSYGIFTKIRMRQFCLTDSPF